MNPFPQVYYGDVGQVVAGQHIAAALYNGDQKGTPYLTGPADFGAIRPVVTKWTMSPKVMAKRSDVLLTVKGNGVGKSNLGEDAAIGRQLMALRPDVSKLDQNYLFRFLRSRIHQINALGQGATVPGIAKGDIEGLQIPLPPLPEQRRIAAILDQADAIRRKRQKAIELTEKFLKSAFLEMFGDPVTNPKGWNVLSFSEVSDSRLGKMLDAKKQTGDENRPYMRNINVQWGRIDLTNVWEMDFSEKDRKEFRLLPGDVLICEGGAGVAQTAIWRGEIDECYFQK